MTDDGKPLAPIVRARNLVRDLHMIRAIQSAAQQADRVEKTGESLNLLLLAPTPEERELVVNALIEQLHITEGEIKNIIKSSTLADDLKDRIIEAIDAGEWEEEKKDDPLDGRIT